MNQKQAKSNLKKGTYVAIGLLLFFISSGKIAYDNWSIDDAIQVADQVLSGEKLAKNYDHLVQLPDYDGTNQVVKLNNNQPYLTKLIYQSRKKDGKPFQI